MASEGTDNVDLNTIIHDHELRSPIMGASSHFTGRPETVGRMLGWMKNPGGLWVYNPDSQLVMEDSTAGGVSLKTTTGKAARGPDAEASMTEPEKHRIAVLPEGSALNCETSYPHDFASYLELLEASLAMGKPLMISVGYEEDEIRKTISEIRQVVDGSGCPVMFELSLHHAEDDKTIMDRILAAVNAAGDDYPVFVKISYYDGDYLRIAKMAVEECGARGIVGINSLGPFDAQGTLTAGEKGWVSGNVIGNVSLEIALQVTDSVCGPNEVPYVAVGGVNDENILDYFRAGASAVQVCTYLMTHGIENGLVTLTHALRTALARAGVRSPSELRGVGYSRERINLSEGLGQVAREVARLLASSGLQKVADLVNTRLRVNEEDCSGCGSCVDACAEGAITIEEEVAKIHEDLCAACSECRGVCLQDALYWEEAV